MSQYPLGIGQRVLALSYAIAKSKECVMVCKHGLLAAHPCAACGEKVRSEHSAYGPSW